MIDSPMDLCIYPVLGLCSVPPLRPKASRLSALRRNNSRAPALGRGPASAVRPTMSLTTAYMQFLTHWALSAVWSNNHPFSAIRPTTSHNRRLCIRPKATLALRLPASGALKTGSWGLLSSPRAMLDGFRWEFPRLLARECDLSSSSRKARAGDALIYDEFLRLAHKKTYDTQANPRTRKVFDIKHGHATRQVRVVEFTAFWA